MADKVMTGFGWYRFEGSVQTNISVDYLDDEGAWDEWAAFRECVQNAMDEADWVAEQEGGIMADYCKCEIRPDDGRIHLSDRGRGVDFEHIALLGRSDKRGSQFRGEKGEGQLLSFLVFAKAGVDIQMFSKDWMVKPRFDKYNGGDNDVLVLDLYRNTVPDNPRAPVGTHWFISGSSDATYYARNLGEYFPEFSRAGVRQQEADNRRRVEEWVKGEKHRERAEVRERKRKSTSSTKIVFKPHKGKPPRLYLRGIYVQDLMDEPKSLFSYNLNDVAINRDRNMVDQFELVGEVGKALAAGEVTPAMMKEFWGQARDRADFLEYRCDIKGLTSELSVKWLRAFKATFGRKVCIATHSDATKDCMANGWTVISVRSPCVQEFACDIGVQTDREAGGFGDEDFRIVEPSDHELVVLDLVEQVVEELEVAWKEVKIFNKVLGNESTIGFYQCDVVYIKHSHFRAGGLEILKTVLHELGHAESGAGDYDRSFTDWFLAQLVGVFAVDDPDWFVRVVKLVKELGQV